MLNLLKISFLLLVCLLSLDMAYGSCRETRRTCLRGCLQAKILVHEHTLAGARTDFLNQCETACNEGARECDIYSQAQATPAQCGHFESRCQNYCPQKVFVYANLQGILVGYTERTNASEVCKSTCTIAHKACDPTSLF